MALCLGGIARGSTVCPPQVDQVYAFSPSPKLAQAMGRLPVLLQEGAFVWPQLPAGADSALLWVRIEGGADTPVDVRLAAHGVSSIQTLPPGSTGWRALNASALIGLPAGQPVSLSVAPGRVAEPGARLETFTNRLPLNQRILVLAPHPDDAELAAFGLYAGRNSTIVTITAGNAGDFNYCEVVSDAAAHYRLKGQLRVIDSVTVPWQGQVPVERAYNLGYFDARLQAMLVQPSVPVKEAHVDNDDVLPYRSRNQGRLLLVGPRKATWHNLVEDLRMVLVKVRPQVVVTPDPRLDMHRDHQLTTVALAQALTQTQLAPRILLYTNHADRNRHPLGPAGQDLPPPPWCGNEPLRALSFYAHPLPPALQANKLMALESMHDLRLPPNAQFRYGWQPQEACKSVPPLPPPESTLLRNAVRPFELFFVADRKLLFELAQASQTVP